ncbi:hypothetical protein CROQUDRAFT_659652 [Cronartium quercuum f. sp. fusiforme G11]|uniref:Uncharacterized protein n=1 Tax=Cronartium quercuum f. sp. fusiforme G11 TaxID=708437 RepID=A0A9P6NDG5_9BASI|nr:hypothetical protein CROQUDRAFT_659652 [Cronartium quercuum f. sp. fusiforme G11]
MYLLDPNSVSRQLVISHPSRLESHLRPAIMLLLNLVICNLIHDYPKLAPSLTLEDSVGFVVLAAKSGLQHFNSHMGSSRLKRGLTSHLVILGIGQFGNKNQIGLVISL